jgi:hypothetical protein
LQASISSRYSSFRIKRGKKFRNKPIRGKLWNALGKIFSSPFFTYLSYQQFRSFNEPNVLELIDKASCGGIYFLSEA